MGPNFGEPLVKPCSAAVTCEDVAALRKLPAQVKPARSDFCRPPQGEDKCHQSSAVTACARHIFLSLVLSWKRSGGSRESRGRAKGS